MRDILHSAAALLLPPLVLCSCMQKLPQPSSGEISDVSFELPQLDGTDTKATIINNGQNFVWEAEDSVGICPDEGSQVYFSMRNGAGSSTASFDGGGWALKSASKYYSYYPFIGDIYLDKENIPVSFEGQYQTGTGNLDNVRDYLYMYAAGEVTGSSLKFSYRHLCTFLFASLTLPTGIYDRLTLTADESVFVREGHYSLVDSSPAIIGEKFTDELTVTLNDFSVTDASAQYEANLLVAPVNLKGKQIKVSVRDTDGNEHVFLKTPSREYLAGKRYGLSCRDGQVAVHLDNPDALQDAVNNGNSSISVDKVPSEDVNLDLSSVSGNLSISFPPEEAAVNISMSYPDDASQYPEKMELRLPVSSSLDLHTPGTTVTVDGSTINSIRSVTADNTLILRSSVNAGTVAVIRGSVINNGVIECLDFSGLEEDVSLLNYGVIETVAGLDDDWNSVSGHHVSLYEATGSRIGKEDKDTQIVLCGEYTGNSRGTLYIASVYRAAESSYDWEKYAHGLFSDQSLMTLKTAGGYRYRIKMQAVENGVDSLYHYNDLHNGGSGFPFYYEAGRLLNSFVYHCSDTSDDDFYENVGYGTTWYRNNNRADNSVLRIYYGSADQDGSSSELRVPLYYARFKFNVTVNGLENAGSYLQCTADLRSSLGFRVDKDDDTFSLERSMYDLDGMMESIYGGLPGYEPMYLTIKYKYSVEGVSYDKTLLNSELYLLEREKETTFTVNVNEDAIRSGDSGFIVRFDSSMLSQGDTYTFNDRIRE